MFTETSVTKLYGHISINGVTVSVNASEKLEGTNLLISTVIYYH